MATELSAEAFHKLLQRLAPDDPDKASAEYLRLKRTALFILRREGISDADAPEIADRCLDRLARQIAAGVKIESVPAYLAGIVKNSIREHRRKNPQKEIEMSENDGFRRQLQTPPAQLKDADPTPECLDECVKKICPGEADRKLLIGYYAAAENEKNRDNRRRLADEFGLTYTNLTTKMSRLRNRLEKCVRDCVAKK